jgi:hypothetical protein
LWEANWKWVLTTGHIHVDFPDADARAGRRLRRAGYALFGERRLFAADPPTIEEKE